MNGVGAPRVTVTEENSRGRGAEAHLRATRRPTPMPYAVRRGPLSERELRAHDPDEAVGDGPGLVRVGGLDHDPDDGLGARLAQEHAPAVTELGLGSADGVGHGEVVLEGALVDVLDVDENLREAGHDAGELGEVPAGRGHPRGEHEPGERAVAGRAVVEHDDVTRLLAAEGEATVAHALEDVAVA